MQKIFDELEMILRKAVSKSEARHICLSGGLDSSIIAFFLKYKKIRGTAIICKDFLGTDLAYCQIVSKNFGIPLEIKYVSMDELISAIEETIKILKNFNDIEIRNSVVMYLALKSIKKHGGDKAITGDGADELFAGYNFFLKKEPKELQEDLDRICKTMHFTTNEIAKALNIEVESPFLSKNMIKFAKKLPVSYKVRKEGDKKYGKWILRKVFENRLPRSIIWREKSPMQDGAGTASLTNLFETLVSDEDFEQSKKQIEESDHIIIRTKESLHYYKIFKKHCKFPKATRSSQTKCPFCNYEVKIKTKFCRMCGSFPI